MVIYEITAIVGADLIDGYERYMRGRHIPDLLETGYFVGAKFARAAVGRYRVQYFAPDATALENYLEREAGRLRTDFLDHFPAGIELAREVWEIVEEWPAGT